jgi:hypothetical protein
LTQRFAAGRERSAAASTARSTTAKAGRARVIELIKRHGNKRVEERIGGGLRREPAGQRIEAFPSSAACHTQAPERARGLAMGSRRQPRQRLIERNPTMDAVDNAGGLLLLDVHCALRCGGSLEKLRVGMQCSSGQESATVIRRRPGGCNIEDPKHAFAAGEIDPHRPGREDAPGLEGVVSPPRRETRAKV